MAYDFNKEKSMDYKHENGLPIEWEDVFEWEPQRKVLIEEQLHIPGLHTMGWSKLTNAGIMLPPHYHKDCIEIAFDFTGKHLFNTGGTDYYAIGGDVVFHGKDVVHSNNSTPMSIGELVWFQLDMTAKNNFLFLNSEASKKLINELNSVKLMLIKTDNKLIRKIARVLVDEMHAYDGTCNSLAIASYLVVFLQEVLQFEKSEYNRSSDDMVKACRYVDEHIKENIPLADIAKEVGLSLSQFKFKFKSQMGITPRTYINERKIEAIKSELGRGKTYTEISNEYGFCNSAYFTAVFKKYTGFTPTEYLARREK